MSETASQYVGNLAIGFLGEKPLFSNGVQIGTWSVGGGYFDTVAQDVVSTVCNEQVTLSANVTTAQLDPTTWQTWDDWGNLVPVQSYCIQKGVAPSWLTQDQVNTLAASTAAGGLPSWALPVGVAAGLIVFSLLLTRR